MGWWRNGRRSGLKIRRGQLRVGSNPTRPTREGPLGLFLFLAFDVISLELVVAGLQKQVAHFWRETVPDVSRVVAGVSGGPDSLALLQCCCLC